MHEERRLLPRQESYGRILKEARERDGYDLTTMARRLHIRPDILRAIEDGDLDRMPPKGYTQNMIRAYARAVGLNQNALSDMYLDAVHLYETGRNRASGRGRDGRDTARSSSLERRREGRGVPPTQRSQRMPRNGSSRATRRLDVDQGYGYVGGSQRRSRGRAPGYPSVYSDMRSNQRSLPSLPVWIVIAVIAVAVIIVLIVLFNSNKQAVEEVPDIPISGLTDTSNPEEETSAAIVEQPPQKAVFTFSVEAGGKSWIEVTQDGDTVLSEVISGPYTENFDVEGTLTFRTANPSPITIQVDGTEVDLKRSSGSEYYTYTVDFADILETWKKEHEDSSSSSATSASSSSRASSSSSSSSSRSRTSE